jgi:hypothetical protein
MSVVFDLLSKVSAVCEHLSVGFELLCKGSVVCVHA